MILYSYFCFAYYPGEDLEQQVTREQYNMLRQRQNESIAKGEAAAAAANAFLEGAADDNPEYAPDGYEPPPGSFRGDLYKKQQGLGPDIDEKIASYLRGGKKKTKTKKQRNKTRKRDKKSKLRKRKTSYRKSKR